MNEHTRASELLPWMVNGRIEATDAQWLNDHLASCAMCRSELAAERRIREALTREPTVEFAPQASFNRLWKRIEAEADAPPQPVATTDVTRTGRTVELRRPSSVRPWLRFALAAQAAAILVLCGVLWLRPGGAGSYRTVTDAAPAPAVEGPLIKAIFDEQVRLVDLKEILGSAGLRVAAGPSDAGVYALVPRDPKATPELSATAAKLRADPRVRFAEIGAQ